MTFAENMSVFVITFRKNLKETLVLISVFLSVTAGGLTVSWHCAITSWVQ